MKHSHINWLPCYVCCLACGDAASPSGIQCLRHKSSFSGLVTIVLLLMGTKVLLKCFLVLHTVSSNSCISVLQWEAMSIIFHNNSSCSNTQKTYWEVVWTYYIQHCLLPVGILRVTVHSSHTTLFFNIRQFIRNKTFIILTLSPLSSNYLIPLFLFHWWDVTRYLYQVQFLRYLYFGVSIFFHFILLFC